MVKRRDVETYEAEPPARLNGEPAPVISPDLFDEGEPPENFDSALQSVVAELAGRDDDSKVTVYSLTIEQGQKKEAYLYECPAADFTLQDLQASYGPGQYRVKVYGRMAGDSIRRVIHANKKIHIGTPRAGAARGLASVPAVASQAGQAPDVSRAVAEALAAPLGALVNAIAAMSANQNNRGAMLEEMKTFAHIFGVMKPAPAPDPLAGLGMVRQIADLIRSLSPERPPLNDDGEISGNAVLYKGIETVANMIQAAKGQQSPPPAPEGDDAPQLPAPANAPAAPIQLPPENDPVKLALKMQLLIFLNAAKSNLETDLYSNLILEQAPDEIIDAFSADDWWSKLTELEKGFEPFKTWCEKLRAEVLSGLTEEPDAATLPANGDPSGGKPAATE